MWTQLWILFLEVAAGQEVKQAVKPTTQADSSSYQSLVLKLVNEKRAKHCAEPLKWSAELTKVAKNFSDGDAKDFPREMAFLIYKQGSTYTIKDGVQKIIDSSRNFTRSATENAFKAWYGVAGAYESTQDMIDAISKEVAPASNSFATLLWKAASRIGCRAKPSPAAAAAQDKSETKYSGVVVCAFASEHTGPQLKSSPDAHEPLLKQFDALTNPYLYYLTQLSPVTDLGSCPPYEQEVPEEAQYESFAKAILGELELFRGTTCATERLVWDETMKDDVQKLMKCFADNHGVLVTKCKDLSRTLFAEHAAHVATGQYAGIVTAADECPYDVVGCGATFNNPIIRATITAKNWFDRWSQVLPGVSLPNSKKEFETLFANMTEKEKSDLDLFWLLNWGNADRIFCDTHSVSFTDSKHVKKNFIICALRNKNAKRPPAVTTSGNGRAEHLSQIFQCDTAAPVKEGMSGMEKLGQSLVKDVIADKMADENDDKMEEKMVEELERIAADADQFLLTSLVDSDDTAADQVLLKDFVKELNESASSLQYIEPAVEESYGKPDSNLLPNYGLKSTKVSEELLDLE